MGVMMMVMHGRATVSEYPLRSIPDIVALSKSPSMSFPGKFYIEKTHRTQKIYGKEH
jgi:hypothetical protein